MAETNNTRYYLERNQPIEPLYGFTFPNDTKLVLSGDTVYNVDITYKLKVITWVVANPTSGTTILGPKLYLNSDLYYTPIYVHAYVSSATNCVINIYGGDVGSMTQIIPTTGLTVTTSECSTSYFDWDFAYKDWVELHINSVSGTPQQLAVSLTLYPVQNT